MAISLEFNGRGCHIHFDFPFFVETSVPSLDHCHHMITSFSFNFFFFFWTAISVPGVFNALQTKQGRESKRDETSALLDRRGSSQSHTHASPKLLGYHDDAKLLRPHVCLFLIFSLCTYSHLWCRISAFGTLNQSV